MNSDIIPLEKTHKITKRVKFILGGKYYVEKEQADG